jgi:4-hydroxybenzoate polyprenyltransferase
MLKNTTKALDGAKKNNSVGELLGLTMSFNSKNQQKDLENLKGDLANNYQTIPVVYSTSLSKRLITACVVLASVPIFILVEIYEVGYMNVFFYSAYASLLLFLVLLKKATTPKHYVWLHNGLKLIIVFGVFSILLIEPNVILKSKILVLFY